MFVLLSGYREVYGLEIISIDEIDSTNSYAKLNIEKFDDRTIISADKQTNGHGRFNRVWVDLGEGNLFISIVLKPSDKFCEVYSNLTQYLCVVLCRVFELYGLNPEIKWPNDILTDGKKISGILSETVMQGENFKGLVLGLGVNLNASKDALKQITDRKTTALNIELGREYVDKKLFLEKLLSEFFKDYENFLNNGFKIIKSEYMSRIGIIGKHVDVSVFNKHYSGLVKDINNRGELVLVQSGKEKVLSIGDIL